MKDWSLIQVWILCGVWIGYMMSWGPGNPSTGNTIETVAAIAAGLGLGLTVIYTTLWWEEYEWRI